MHEFYGKNEPTTTTDFGLCNIPERWRIYPIYGLNDEGVCVCPKREECGDPGKHPHSRAAPHGQNSASSDPRRIAEMFSVAGPGANVGAKTGRVSDLAVIDVDYEGWESLNELEAEHGELPRTRLHQSGSSFLHYLFRYPEGVERLPSRTGANALAPGLELLADGHAVVLPPSRHWLGGQYHLLLDHPLAPLPDWVVELALLKLRLKAVEGGGEGAAGRTESRFELPDRVREGARNDTLHRYASSLRACGWDHGEILDELRRVAREACEQPPIAGHPLGDDEVRKIAKSVLAYDPGNASRVSPEVLAAAALLEEKARARPKSGLGAHSRWALYRAVLHCVKAHGWLHRGRDVAVRISVRRLALDAGLSKSTTQEALRWLEASKLVYRISRGDGPVPGALALRVPDTDVVGTFAPPPRRPPNVPSPSVSGALYRLRHGAGRIGKPAAAVLEEVVDCPGASRGELAARLGKKPDSLSRPLKKLVDRGLLERGAKGRYRPAQDWERVLDRERTLTGEKLAENLDRAAYEREREAYRLHLEEKKRREGGAC